LSSTFEAALLFGGGLVVGGLVGGTVMSKRMENLCNREELRYLGPLIWFSRKNLLLKIEKSIDNLHVVLRLFIEHCTEANDKLFFESKTTTWQLFCQHKSDFRVFILSGEVVEGEDADGEAVDDDQKSKKART
jgi:hypothetical protein